MIHPNSLRITPFVSCTDQPFSLFKKKKASGWFHKGLKLKKERKKKKILVKRIQQCK